MSTALDTKLDPKTMTVPMDTYLGLLEVALTYKHRVTALERQLEGYRSVCGTVVLPKEQEDGRSVCDVSPLAPRPLDPRTD